MVRISFASKFQNFFYKIKDNLLKQKIIKQIKKIKENPEIGKPIKNTRKRTCELYIKPFRLSYVYFKDENKIVLLDLYHKQKQ